MEANLLVVCAGSVVAVAYIFRRDIRPLISKKKETNIDNLVKELESLVTIAETSLQKVTKIIDKKHKLNDRKEIMTNLLRSETAIKKFNVKLLVIKRNIKQ